MHVKMNLRKSSSKERGLDEHSGSALMRNTSDFLLQLQRRGVRVRAKDGKLHIRAPEGGLLQEESDGLRLMKPDILLLLEQNQLADMPPIERRSADCMVPWRHIEIGSRFRVRICSFAVRMLGVLDCDLLRRSLEALIERHEALRIRPCVVAGVVYQKVDVVSEYRLEVTTVDPMPDETPEHAATRLASEFIEKKFDFYAEPLFASSLFRLADQDHILAVAMDHAISDASSLEILERELWVLYSRGLHGLPLLLAPLSIQFGDYSLWKQRIRKIWLEKYGSYWKHRLAGAKSTIIPVDATSDVKQPPGAIFQAKFGDRLTYRLQELARREGTLLALVVLVTYVCVMSRWCHSSELVVAFFVAGRDLPELQNMVGGLVSVAPLRVSIQAGDTFTELLRRVCQEFHAMQNHTGLSFGEIDEIVPEYIRPLEISFNWTQVNWSEGTVSLRREIGRDLTVKPFALPRSPISTKFVPIFSCTPASIVSTVYYQPDVLRPETLEWFGASLKFFANEFAENPQRLLATIDISVPKIGEIHPFHDAGKWG